jgi:hypothetical protein
MHQELNDPIQVAVIFSNSQLRPVKFVWRQREYKIDQVNLSYNRFDGRSKIYYFAVSDGANYFKLRFDSNSLVWSLIETYVE